MLRSRALVAGIVTLVVGCSKDAATSASGVSVASIALASTSISVGVGATETLTAYVRGSNLELLPNVSGLRWTSSNTAIATVDSTGSVRGVALGGPVTITVSKESQSATAVVTVTPAFIVVSPSITTLAAGQSVQLTATPYDFWRAPLSAPATAWSVYSMSIAGGATISASGLLTAIAPTFVHIYATIAGKILDIPIGVPGDYDGGWAGTDANGLPVRLTIQFGSVTSFSLPSLPVQACTTTQYVTQTSAPIVNNHFTFSVGGFGGTTTVPISGTLTSLSAMTGSYGSIGLGIVHCDNGTSSTRAISGSAFTASR